MNLIIQRTLLSAALAGLISVACADNSSKTPAATSAGSPPPAPADGKQERHHGPPPEAYQACEGKAAGNEAKLTGPGGEEVKGVCEDDGAGKLVLRPTHPGKNARHGPPPEAYQACEGKAEGSEARMTTPRGEVVGGVCEKEVGGKMVLRLDCPRHKAGGRREPPPEAFQACEGKTVGSAAQLTTPRGDVVNGTCEKEGDRLFLRPDRH